MSMLHPSSPAVLSSVGRLSVNTAAQPVAHLPLPLLCSAESHAHLPVQPVPIDVALQQSGGAGCRSQPVTSKALLLAGQGMLEAATGAVPGASNPPKSSPPSIRSNKIHHTCVLVVAFSMYATGVKRACVTTPASSITRCQSSESGIC